MLSTCFTACPISDVAVQLCTMAVIECISILLRDWPINTVGWGGVRKIDGGVKCF